MNPHNPRPTIGPRPNLVTFDCHQKPDFGAKLGQLAQIWWWWKILVAIWQPIKIINARMSNGDQKWFSHNQWPLVSSGDWNRLVTIKHVAIKTLSALSCQLYNRLVGISFFWSFSTVRNDDQFFSITKYLDIRVVTMWCTRCESKDSIASQAWLSWQGKHQRQMISEKCVRNNQWKF